MSATIKQVLLNTADQFEAGDDRHANIIDVLNRLSRVAPNTLDEVLDFAELVTDVASGIRMDFSMPHSS